MKSYLERVRCMDCLVFMRITEKPMVKGSMRGDVIYHCPKCHKEYVLRNRYFEAIEEKKL